MKEKESTVEKKWKAHGLDCKVIFVRQSHRCGYVAVPKGHVAFDKDYDDLPIDVHGGLTYGQLGDDGQQWFGFDCAHLGDAQKDGFPSLEENEHFWTLEEVVKETEQMAQQFSKLTLRAIILEKMRWMPDWFKENVSVVGVEK